MSSLPFNLVAAKPIILITFSISAIKQNPIHFITAKLHSQRSNKTLPRPQANVVALS